MKGFARTDKALKRNANSKFGRSMHENIFHGYEVIGNGMSIESPIHSSMAP